MSGGEGLGNKMTNVECINASMPQFTAGFLILSAIFVVMQVTISKLTLREAITSLIELNPQRTHWLVHVASLAGMVGLLVYMLSLLAECNPGSFEHLLTLDQHPSGLSEI
jgi:hypothetical protein